MERDFNPLPRKEGDALFHRSRRCTPYFNPLPRKEGDAGQKISGGVLKYFNPLPRKEGDDDTLFCFVSQAISIHSLVKRETLLPVSTGIAAIDFNPLPRKEGDQTGSFRYADGHNFNPLPRKEGDAC